MMYKVKTQHYDIVPGTVVYKAGVSPADTNMYGITYFLVTEKEGDKTEGSLRVIPEYKLEKM